MIGTLAEVIALVVVHGMKALMLGAVLALGLWGRPRSFGRCGRTRTSARTVLLVAGVFARLEPAFAAEPALYAFLFGGVGGYFRCVGRRPA